jgi:hypothetical protein
MQDSAQDPLAAGLTNIVQFEQHILPVSLSHDPELEVEEVSSTEVKCSTRSIVLQTDTLRVLYLQVRAQESSAARPKFIRVETPINKVCCCLFSRRHL